MNDVMKHFNRKSISDEDDLFSRFPASPTPSVISCSTVTDGDDRTISPSPATSSVQQSPPRLVVLTKLVSMTGFEAALQAMRVLAQASVSVICTASPTPWQMPCQIVKDLTHAQYYLNVGHYAEACASYDKALSILPHMETSSCMSTLQLTLHLLAWSMHENTTTLTRAIFHYLAEAKSSVVHPILAVIAKTLGGVDESQLLFKIGYQQVLCDIFEHRLEPQSSILFWARLRLCRSLFLQGQLDRARTLLVRIEHERASTSHLLRSFLRYEMIVRLQLHFTFSATTKQPRTTLMAYSIIIWAETTDMVADLHTLCNNWLPATLSSDCTL
jgi:hypothetical protein